MEGAIALLLRKCEKQEPSAGGASTCVFYFLGKYTDHFAEATRLIAWLSSAAQSNSADRTFLGPKIPTKMGGGEREPILK